MMDVREKLVELLAPTSLDFEQATYLADYLVKNGVTVQEWISVEKRLPDVGVEVLVYSEIVGICVGYYDVDAFGYFYVTHWMPLPEPPKGE